MSVVLLLLVSLAAESRGQDTPQIPKKDDSQLQVILGDGTAELSGMWEVPHR